MGVPAVIAWCAAAAAAAVVAAATETASPAASRRALRSSGGTASSGTLPAERPVPPSLPGKTQSNKQLLFD
jgi:hypothetical protein